MDSVLASHPAALGSILGVPKDSFFTEIWSLILLRLIDSALFREWTVQGLIVDRTHLVLVSVKLILQKRQQPRNYHPPIFYRRSSSVDLNIYKLPHFHPKVDKNLTEYVKLMQRAHTFFKFKVL